MSAQSEQSKPDSLEAEIRPIELVTDNGFSILRLWELSAAAQPAAGNYQFIVRKQSLEREITVKVRGMVVVQTELQTRGRILISSTFWICCAERRLASYLWENDAFPPGDQLLVEQLDPEDHMSAIRWSSTGK